MKFKPTYDNLLIKQRPATTQIGSITIPVNSQERHVIGDVIAVGPGMYNDNGVMLPLLVKKGDSVLFLKSDAKETKIANDTFLLLKETDVLGIVEE